MIGIMIGLFLITILAIFIVLSYTPICINSQEYIEQIKANNEAAENDKGTLKSDFISSLYKNTFALSLDVLQYKENNLEPSKVFLPGNMLKEYDKDTEAAICTSLNSTLNIWYLLLPTTIKQYPSLIYYAMDNKTGKVSKNSIDSLSSFMDGTAWSQGVIDSYPFFMIIDISEDRGLRVLDYKGLDEKDINDFLSKQLLQESGGYVADWYQVNNKIVTPDTITIVYASKASDFYKKVDYNYTWDYNGIFARAGLGYVGIAALICILLLALVLPMKKSWAIGTGTVTTKIPLEINVFVILFTIIVGQKYLLSMAWATVSSGAVFFDNDTVLSKPVQNALSYGFNIVIWMLVLFLWYVAALSIRQVLSLGLTKYVKEKTITVRGLNWLIQKMKLLIKSIESFDFSAKSNKLIIQILAINFVVLAIISCTWFVGIILLIPYTIVIFVLIYKYLEQIKKKHAILLEATSKIAEGYLDVTIEENLGVFEPLKKELIKVQEGFMKAVKEETKSERMKTELITNVSHDLKTPLTAIITYVGLLKDERITGEERKVYIDTLDMKCQRLKRLIEDIFEVTRASTKNIVLYVVEVDIVNLIKQVLIELDDKIKMMDIEFRFNHESPKVLLELDSDKTCRIFENLIINVTKYALPHTRAYIDIIENENTIVITIKNVSACELNFNTDEISERFVRGDQSRNTEGSGLGLAITKSFVELQGGKFSIITDGDLFKAVIEWKKSI